MKSEYPTPFLVSLLKDEDPRIRTLAADALVAKGDMRLQQYLAPLVRDQAATFDLITALPTNNYTPPRYTKNTVGAAVLRLVEMTDAGAFDRYWAVHANREFCTGWFLWEFLHPHFAARARQQIQKLPSPDRELTMLWIGDGKHGVNNQFDGYSQMELLDAAKKLGRVNVLEVLRHQAPTTDPDLLDVDGSDLRLNYRDYWVAHFLLAHVKDLLVPSDAKTLFDLESAERSANNRRGRAHREWWYIAAAHLQPSDAKAILDEADKRWNDAADIQLARWDLQGPAALPGIIDRFYSSPKAQESLVWALYPFDAGDPYQPLVMAILASDRRAQITGEAMYRFIGIARRSHANIDREIADWVFAQPPDPDMGVVAVPRRLVVDTSGIARQLVRDPRFENADGQLLYVIEQRLVGDLALTREQEVRLAQLTTQLYSQHPQSSPPAVLQETRALLRKGVGAD